MNINPSIVIGLGPIGQEVTEAFKKSIAFRFDDFPIVEVVLYPGPVDSNPGDKKEKESKTTKKSETPGVRLEARNQFKKSIHQFTGLFDSAVAKVTSIEAEQSLREIAKEIPITKSRVVNIYIIGGLSEPESSGVFIDIGYFCRYQLDIKHSMDGFSINGIFVIPPILAKDFSPLKGIEDRKMVGMLYATLKELDHFLETRKFHIDYLKPKVSFQNEKPFTSCYLLDVVKSNRVTLTDARSLIPITGEILFHFIFPPVGENVTNALTSQVLSSYFLDQKITAYSGIGLASVGFPEKDMLKAVALRYGIEIIDYGLFRPEPEESEIEEEITAFERTNGLEKEHFLKPYEDESKDLLEEIKEEIEKETDVRSFKDSPWHWASIENLNIVERKSGTLKERFKSQWQEAIRQNVQKKIKRLQNNVNTRKAELLHSRRKDRADKSVQCAPHFLKKLNENVKKYLTQCKDKKQKHRQEAQRLERIQEVNRGRLSDLYQSIPAKWKISLGSALIFLFSLLIFYLAFQLYPSLNAIIAVSVLFGFEIFGGFVLYRLINSQIIRLRDKVLSNVREWFKEQVDEFDCNAMAQGLNKEFRDFLRKQTKELEQFVKTLEEVKNELKERAEQLHTELSEHKRFITDECILAWGKVLNIYHEEHEGVGVPTHANRNPRHPDDSETIDEWVNKTKGWISEKIETMAREKVNQSRLTQLKVEDLFKEKLVDGNKLNARLKQMLEDSSPLLNYDDIQLPDSLRQSKTLFGYYTGRDPKILESLKLLPSECESIPTRRRDQLLAVSVCHGIPLCNINGIKFYSREYEAIPQDKRTKLHAFENLKSDDYDAAYIKRPLELEAERLCGIALCLKIIYWKKPDPKKKEKKPFLFRGERAIALEGDISPGSKLPFSLDNIIYSEGRLEVLKDEINKKMEKTDIQKVKELLQQGLNKHPLTRIMKKEVESYLEKLGVKK